MTIFHPLVSAENIRLRDSHYLLPVCRCRRRGEVVVLGDHLVIRKNGGDKSPLRAFVGWRGGGGNQVNFIPLPPPLLAINNRQSVSFRQFKC